jgi:hypothetical protein
LTLSAGALLALFLTLYLRPYHGIRHDSILYLGQALLRWHPEVFGHDLFFAFGSQADFTFLPQLLAKLFEHFDAPGLFLWLTLGGRLLFLLASWRLLRSVVPQGFRFWGLLALLVLPGSYGGYGVISYGEPFFTGRSLAEPLALIALAFWWQSRHVLAIGMMLVAAGIHPLQTLPALLVCWIDLVSRDRRWLHLLWFVVLAAIAAQLGMRPFAQWLAAYDALWFDWVKDANPLCLMLGWRIDDWCYLLFDVYLVGMVLRNARGLLLSYARAVLIAAACGLVASLILVDGLHLVLPTGLQLWRVHWLVHWLAMASIPWLTNLQYRAAGNKLDVRLTIFLAMLAVAVPVGAIPLPPYAALILMPLHFFWPKIADQLGPGMKRLVVMGVTATITISLARYLLLVWKLYIQLPDARDMFRPEAVLFAYPLIAGALILGGFRFWHRSHSLRVVLLAILATLTGFAAATWDHRNPWTKQIEAAQNSERIFGVGLAPGAQVFWEDELLAPWLILHRPSYMSYQQQAGLLFNRGTAEEAFKRRAAMNVFNFQKELCQVINGFQPESCVPDDAAVAEVCSGSNGQLVYVVLPYELKTTSAYGSWTVAGGVRGDRPVTYRLYRCEDILASTGNKM